MSIRIITNVAQSPKPTVRATAIATEDKDRVLSSEGLTSPLTVGLSILLAAMSFSESSQSLEKPTEN
jgi:hypothetical protein